MTNVVLFMSDEHNPRYSSVYGHQFVRTPHLERLAARGTVYQNAYCPSPLCVPSRSAFMAGRHVHEIQRYNNCKLIESREPGYGEVLAAQGVHTTYLGSALNLYRDPRQFGFSELIDVTSNPRPVRPADVLRGVQQPDKRVTDAAHGTVADRFATDIEYVDHAVEWLHDIAPGLDRPWTITVNVHPPHPPYTADPEHWGLYEGLGDLPLQEPYLWDDCGWLSNRWCELLPVAAEIKQRCMTLDNPLLRLELVNDMLERLGIRVPH